MAQYSQAARSAVEDSSAILWNSKNTPEKENKGKQHSASEDTELSHDSVSVFRKNTSVCHVWVMAAWLMSKTDASRSKQTRVQRLFTAFLPSPCEDWQRGFLGFTTGFSGPFLHPALPQQGNRQWTIEIKGQTVNRSRSVRSLIHKHTHLYFCLS